MAVYLVQVGDQKGPVKIGHGRNPLRRLVNLQLGSPEPLTLLGTFPGSEVEEQRLHQRFAADHIRGEWFRFNPGMLDGLAPPPVPPKRQPPQPDGRWRGTVDGFPIGPYDKLPTALGVACSLRDKFSR